MVKLFDIICHTSFLISQNCLLPKYPFQLTAILFSMRAKLLILTFFTSCIVATAALSNISAPAATCVGSKSCNACRNCKYCKKCSKDGGTCGVCK